MVERRTAVPQMPWHSPQKSPRLAEASHAALRISYVQWTVPITDGSPWQTVPDHHYTYKEALLGLDSQKRFDACRDQAIPDGC